MCLLDLLQLVFKLYQWSVMFAYVIVFSLQAKGYGNRPHVILLPEPSSLTWPESYYIFVLYHLYNYLGIKDFGILK